MEFNRTIHPEQTAQKLPLGAQTFTCPELLNRHYVCSALGHSLGNVAPGNGLRFGHDLLAAFARLAEGRGLGEDPSCFAKPLTPGRPNRLQTLCRGQRHASCGRGGEKTGPSPVDRRKPGSKHHLLTDGNGIPIVAQTTAANRHDVIQLLPLVNAVPAMAGKCGAPRYRFAQLYADRAYDSEPDRQALRQIGIKPCIAKRRAGHGSGLGTYRWVVERTLSWLHQFRRLRVRYERRADIHQAFVTMGCILICHRMLKNSLC
jgi:transposase